MNAGFNWPDLGRSRIETSTENREAFVVYHRRVVFPDGLVFLWVCDRVVVLVPPVVLRRPAAFHRGCDAARETLRRIGLFAVTETLGIMPSATEPGDEDRGWEIARAYFRRGLGLYNVAATGYLAEFLKLATHEQQKALFRDIEEIGVRIDTMLRLHGITPDRLPAKAESRAFYAGLGRILDWANADFRRVHIPINVEWVSRKTAGYYPPDWNPHEEKAA